MQRTLLTIVVAMLIFSATSGLALAKQGNSLIDELSREDAFHPELVDEWYNEWHYFSIIDEEQELSMITSFKLSGSVPTAQGNIPIAQVLLGYDIGGTSNAAYYAQFGPDTLDGTNIIINNNKVILTERGYEVYVNAVSEDGKQIILDAVFKPCTDPSTLLTVELSPTTNMNWLVASPKMKVTGTFTIKEIISGEQTTYELKDLRGYHDHNWGHWDWADIGWNWGQVTQTKNSLNGNDLGTYTVSFGNVMGNEPASASSVLNVWKNKKIVEEFRNDEVEIEHTLDSLSLLPASTTINAVSDQGNIEIVFTSDYFIQIPIISQSGTIDLIIWEGFGTYVVEGNIDGKDISYEAKGFMEYAPNLPSY